MHYQGSVSSVLDAYLKGVTHMILPGQGVYAADWYKQRRLEERTVKEMTVKVIRRGGHGSTKRMVLWDCLCSTTKAVEPQDLLMVRGETGRDGEQYEDAEPGECVEDDAISSK